MAGKSEVVCSARVAISSRESPRTRTPSAFEERAGHLDQGIAAPVAGGLADRVAMRIEAVQQCRLHGAAPDLPLVEAAGADVRPGLDLPVALGRLVDQHRPCFVEGDAPADQVVGDAGLDRQLARRVVDAGDAGPLLGDHPPGDVFGRCRLGRVARRTIAPLQGGAVAAGRCMPLGRRGFRDHGRLGTLPGHDVLVGLAGRDAVRGGIGVGRRHRLIHVCVLRLLGVLRPVDAGNVPRRQ